jgi:hypothetical protein
MNYYQEDFSLKSIILSDKQILLFQALSIIPISLSYDQSSVSAPTTQL